MNRRWAGLMSRISWTFFGEVPSLTPFEPSTATVPGGVVELAETKMVSSLESFSPGARWTVALARSGAAMKLSAAVTRAVRIIRMKGRVGWWSFRTAADRRGPPL